MHPDENLEDLEREAQAARLEFHRRLRVARSSLSPARLRSELGEGVSRAASSAAHSAAATLGTPAGLLLGGAGLAALFLASKANRGGNGKQNGDARAATEQNAGDAATARSAAEPPREREAVRIRHSALLALASAVGAGMVLDKLVPVSEFEKTTLDDIRPEIRKFASDWVSSKIKAALVPGTASSSGALSLLLGAAGVAAAMSKRSGSAKP